MLCRYLDDDLSLAATAGGVDGDQSTAFLSSTNKSTPSKGLSRKTTVQVRFIANHLRIQSLLTCPCDIPSSSRISIRIGGRPWRWLRSKVRIKRTPLMFLLTKPFKIDLISEQEVVINIKHRLKTGGDDEIIGSCSFPLAMLLDQVSHTYMLYLQQPPHLATLVGRMSNQCHCKATFRLTYSPLRRLQHQRDSLLLERERLLAAANNINTSAAFTSPIGRRMGSNQGSAVRRSVNRVSQ